MLARHLLLVSVFVGGCFSGVLAVGVSRRGADPGKATGDTAQSDEVLVARLAAPNGMGENGTTHAAKQDAPERASDLAPALHDGADRDSTSAPERAHSVGDVLARLEAAYRQQLADAARAPAAPAPVPEPSPLASPGLAASEAPRAASPGGGAAIAAPAHAPPEVAANAPPASSAEVEAPTAAVAIRDATPPRVVYTGNVQQNLHVGELVQGDVYQLQLQQLAMFQYLQVLALSAQPRATVPAPAPPARAPRSVYAPKTRQEPAFPASITNPDNPWGFEFAPPMLAK